MFAVGFSLLPGGEKMPDRAEEGDEERQRRMSERQAKDSIYRPSSDPFGATFSPKGEGETPGYLPPITPI
ncbi:hypothetical protein [Rhizobium sp. Root1203]|uniref:hypothetical protein n=1 Tax=Rhizobium sp. Root1203 TaxID=1736427 RepID=UPI0012E3C4FB|nr:hypothetical protein [Rhizobium sp. Root1203]